MVLRILVICPHFEPDTAPTGVMITEIVKRLGESGHQIEVITSMPWYRQHGLESAWRGRLVRSETVAWGRITRLHPLFTASTNITLRALASLGFTMLCAAAGLFRRGRVDVVLAMSPPLTLGVVGWGIAGLRRVPFVFNVQDAVVDVAIAIGAITRPSVMRFGCWMERFVYRRADAVTVLSTDVAESVNERIGSRRAVNGQRSLPLVKVIPNFADTEIITPIGTDNSYRAEFGLGERTVIMYAGNVGLSQPLDLMIDAAQAFADRSDVVFVVNGVGAAREHLEERAVGSDNIVFVDFQPRWRLAEVLAAADIHVLMLRSGLTRSSVPSKIYSVMAAARALVACIDTDSEPARLIRESDCGLVVDPTEPEAFVDALTELVDDPQRRRGMGLRGRISVQEAMSSTDVASCYAELFEELLRSR